jgi:hypothetical protein
MVLGHNLEENPQRMFAINFVYIGSASGIFGEKNLTTIPNAKCS